MASWIDRIFRAYSVLYENGTIKPSRGGLNLTGNAIVSVTDNPGLDRTDVQIDIPGANDVAAATASPTPNTLVRRNVFGAASFAGTCGFENLSVSAILSAPNSAEINNLYVYGPASFDEAVDFSFPVDFDTTTTFGGVATFNGGATFASVATFTATPVFANITLSGSLTHTGTGGNTWAVSTADPAVGIASNRISISTGTTIGAISGNLDLSTGSTSSGAASGSMTFSTGSTISGGNSGNFDISTGNASGGIATSGSIRIYPGSAAGATGGISLGSVAPSFGGGQRVIYISNRTLAPSSNPSSGGLLYAESGDFKWRTSGGTTVTLGATSILSTLNLSGSIQGTGDQAGNGNLAILTASDGTQSRNILLQTGSSAGGTSGSISLSIGTATTGGVINLFGGNISLGANAVASTFQGGRTVIYIPNRSAAPGTPTSGGILYSENDQLYWQSGNGTRYRCSITPG